MAKMGKVKMKVKGKATATGKGEREGCMMIACTSHMYVMISSFAAELSLVRYGGGSI